MNDTDRAPHNPFAWIMGWICLGLLALTGIASLVTWSWPPVAGGGGVAAFGSAFCFGMDWLFRRAER